MRYGLALAALLAATGAPIASSAATIKEVGPPQNPPSADFTGPQFVDARGCVYMRAGYGGKVTWVPRIDGQHNVLCGYQPTGGATVMAQAPAQAAPAVPVAVVPVAVAAAPAPAPGSASGVVAATYSAPVEAAPIFEPKGYVPAWKDGRLNPLRAQGTAYGQAQMESIYTNGVPMKLKPGAVTLVASGPAAQPVAVTHIQDTAYEAPRLSTSNGAPVAEAAGRFVQVGSFAEPANARGAAARLAALGLPVAMDRGAIHGRPVSVVLAGPFSAPEATTAALAAARGAGFADAFARD